MTDLNTFILSSAAGPVPQVLLSATTPNPSNTIELLPENGGVATFTGAIGNVGAGGEVDIFVTDELLTPRADLPVTTEICVYELGTPACTNAELTTDPVTITMNADDPNTAGLDQIFLVRIRVTADPGANIPSNPVNNRLFLAAQDPVTGQYFGVTSSDVTTSDVPGGLGNN